MRWVGLSPLGLAATLAIAGAVVVALYLLKQQPRRVVVPALALWEQLLARRDAASAFSRLRRLWSLLLALAVLSLVAVGIADLRSRADASARTLVLLVDASASMAATDVSPSRLEVARTRAREILQSLSPSDRAIVVQLDAQATALGPLSDDRVTLTKALSELRQTDLAGDLEAGVRFALDVLHGQKAPELVLLSDMALKHTAEAEGLLRTQPQVKARYVRVGKSERNVAVTSFSVRRYPLDKTHHESIVTVQSFGPESERVKLSIRAGDVLAYEETLDIPARGTVTRTLADLAGADDVLEASITPERGPDPLASDDRAFATLPPRKRTRVLVVSESNTYLEAALLLDEYLDVKLVAPRGYVNANGYDVAIFDRALPPIPPSVPALYLAPPATGGAAPLKVTGEVSRPFFDRIDREHPVVRLVQLSDVNVARASRVTLEQGDAAIAATGDKVPLIVTGARQGTPFVAVTFDVRESDLPLRASWPLLLLGAIDHLAGDTGVSVAKSEAGEVLRIALPDGADRAELVTEDGQREPLSASQGTVRVVRDRAGVYTVASAGVTARVAVNVPARDEGAIAPASTQLARFEPLPAGRTATWSLGERIWPLLLALALALLGIEWLTFHRRWTV